MAEILNLRRFRKARQHADKDESAARNRALFGRPKAERQVAETALRKAARHLDEHRREPDPGSEPDA